MDTILKKGPDELFCHKAIESESLDIQVDRLNHLIMSMVDHKQENRGEHLNPYTEDFYVKSRHFSIFSIDEELSEQSRVINEEDYLIDTIDQMAVRLEAYQMRVEDFMSKEISDIDITAADAFQLSQELFESAQSAQLCGHQKCQMKVGRVNLRLNIKNSPDFNKFFDFTNRIHAFVRQVEDIFEQDELIIKQEFDKEFHQIQFTRDQLTSKIESLTEKENELIEFLGRNCSNYNNILKDFNSYLASKEKTLSKESIDLDKDKIGFYRKIGHLVNKEKNCLYKARELDRIFKELLAMKNKVFVYI